MGDDDVRPGESPPPTGGSHSPVTVEHDAKAHDAAASMEATPSESVGSYEATVEPAPLDAPATAAADLASPDRPAESFAPSVEKAHIETPAARPPRRSIMGGLLATIGLVLIVLLGINLYFMVEPPANGALAAVQAQANGLDQRIGALEKRPAMAPLDNRVKALEDKVGVLASDATKPAQDADIAARVATIDKAIADLHQQVAAIPKPDLGPIEAKTAEIGSAVASVTTDVAGVKTEIEGVKTDLASAKTDIASVKTGMAALSASIAGLDHRFAPIEAEFSAPKIAANVTEARQEGSAAETRAAPLAVTAQAILQAIDDGKGFAPEVTALRSLGTDKAKLAVLEPLAAKGAPTKADLIAGFAAVRDPMVIAAAPVKTGTMLDRMMASAQGLVKVRDSGANPGGDADAIVSRIAAALSAGDLRGALTEWNTLPEESKKPSSAWADQLKARVAAEGTARSIAAGAIAALGPTQ